MNLGFIARAFDRFRGAGEASVTIPSMDGTLRPNRKLDEASSLWTGEGGSGGVPCAPVATADGAGIVFAHGETLLGGPAEGPFTTRHRFDSAITALAIAADGRIAAGLESGALLFGNGDDWTPLAAEAMQFNCITALLFEPDGRLLVANGSDRQSPAHWRRDLMEKNAAGSLWRIDPTNAAAARLADGLAYPAGLALAPDGAIVISEAWRHRLSRLGPGGALQVLVEDLPGYPGALSPDADGGYLLAVFAPRSQLVEFVLREEEYREAMLDEVPEPYWIAPALKSGVSYFEPVQGGGVRHLGIVKPWAPSRSYGLVLRLDAQFAIRESYHSRADAKRHGITGAVRAGGRIVATCAATQELLALPSNGKEGGAAR